MPYLTIYRAHFDQALPGFTYPELHCYLPVASSPAGSVAYPAPVRFEWLAPSTQKRVRSLLPGEELTARIDAHHIPTIEAESARRHGL